MKLLLALLILTTFSVGFAKPLCGTYQVRGHILIGDEILKLIIFKGSKSETQLTIANKSDVELLPYSDLQVIAIGDVQWSKMGYVGKISIQEIDFAPIANARGNNKKDLTLIEERPCP